MTIRFLPDDQASQPITVVPCDQRGNPIMLINGHSYSRLTDELKLLYRPETGVMAVNGYVYIGPMPTPTGTNGVQRQTNWSPTIEITKEPRGWERFR